MSRLASLAKQTAIYGLPSIVGRLLNFLLVPLYTYVFLTREYGVVTEFYAYTAFLMVVLSYGMETTFFRYVQKYGKGRDVFSTALWSLIASSTLFLLFILFFKDPMASLMGYSSQAYYLVWFAVILVADTLGIIPFCLLRQQERALKFASLKMTNILFNIGLNLFFILYCPYKYSVSPDSWIAFFYDPSLGVGYIFLSNLISSVLTFILQFGEWRKIRFKFDVKLWKEMMWYGLPIMIWGMSGIVNETFDRIFLKYLIVGPDAMEQLGIYGACYKISIIMTLFVQAFRFAAEPFFFKQATGKDAPQVYARLMKYFVIICAFIFLASTLFLEQIMYFVGKDFREGQRIVPVLLMANLFLGIFYNLSVWYKVTDRTRVGAYISTIGAGVTLLLNFWWIPLFGYYGAAWATFCCYLFIALLSYLWGRKYYSIPYPKKTIALYLILVVSLYLIKVLFLPSVLYIQIIYAGLALSLFLFIVYKAENRRGLLKIGGDKY